MSLPEAHNASIKPINQQPCPVFLPMLSKIAQKFQYVRAGLKQGIYVIILKYAK
jgi:hypothetical protein